MDKNFYTDRLHKNIMYCLIDFVIFIYNFIKLEIII
jgi:hypothetical protein